MNNATLTEFVAETNATYYTKAIHLNTVRAVVEPTFTDGEWSALITDDHGNICKEKFFDNEDDAHFWTMRQVMKAAKDF